MKRLTLCFQSVAVTAAIVVGILLLSMSPSLSAPWMASVGGVVRDVYRTPIGHVRVFVSAGPNRGLFTFTDSHGMYHLVGVEPGTYEMIFSHDGYDSRLARFDLCPNEIADVDPMLLSRQTTLDLRVYGKEARFANSDSAAYSVNGVGSRFSSPRACF